MSQITVPNSMILGESSSTVDGYSVQDYLNNLGIYKSMEPNEINLSWTMSLQGHLLSALKSGSPCQPRKGKSYAHPQSRQEEEFREVQMVSLAYFLQKLGVSLHGSNLQGLEGQEN